MASKKKRPTLERRVADFRALVYRGVSVATERGYRLKSYEGALSLHWPPFVHVKSSRGRYSLHLSCTIVGGSSDQPNHYAWRGRSWGEVFRRATADVEFWISQIGRQS